MGVEKGKGNERKRGGGTEGGEEGEMERESKTDRER